MKSFTARWTAFLDGQHHNPRGLVGAIIGELYYFTRDSANLSVCYDRCATVWPPVLVGDITVGLDGIGGSVSSFRRNDGNRQLAYEGKPLYYYASDAAPGDTKGQGIGNVWYIIPPAPAN